ncbi:hypothetical protein ACNKHL_06430 [Shigella flexneri]
MWWIPPVVVRQQSLSDGGTLLTNDRWRNAVCQHHFSAGPLHITTCMHRRAGSERETVQAVTDGALIDIRICANGVRSAGRA